MTTEIADAVKSRWDDASLDTSIAALYPGSDGDEGESSPEGTSLPRAEYVLPQDSEGRRSRGTREMFQPLRFRVWGANSRTVRGYIVSIESSFVNSQLATPNPLSIASSVGTILGVNHVGKGSQKEDEGIYGGIVNLSIHWAKPNAVPA